MISTLIRTLKQRWIDELKFNNNYSKHTVICYQRDLDNFFSFLMQYKNNEINIEILKDLKVIDFRAWLSQRVNNKFSARSNVRALSSIKSFFRYLAKSKIMELQSINNIHRPKLDKLLPKPIPENDILAFLNESFYFENDPDWITDRDKALYTLLYSTGLRISEALSIKTRDIGTEIKVLGKGKKDRIVILFPITIQRINTYINSCPYDLTENYLFVGVRGKPLRASSVDIRLEKLRIRYNLPEHTSAHAFRHSFASHLIQEGADLRSVQELLGHESLSSTQIYTDVDDYNLLKIYEKTHPLEN